MATINIPSNAQVIPCATCGTPALGVYTWAERNWGRDSVRQRILCAACGLNISNVVKMFIPSDADEPIFYKPNHDVKILATFEYVPTVQPGTPSPIDRSDPRLIHKCIPPTFAPGMAAALSRNATHDDSRTPLATRGKPRLQWMKRISCSGCGCVYGAVRARKCPRCEQVNSP